MRTQHFSLSWWLVLGVYLISALSLYWFGAMAYQTDSPSYVNALLLWAGEPADADRLFRLSKPLSLLFPLLAYKLFNLPVLYGIFIQQYIAYCSSSFLVYKILQRTFPYPSPCPAYGAIAYLLCQPMAVYGLAFLTDGLGWCLLLGGILWSQYLFESTRPTPIACLFFGLYLGSACFVKESIVIAGLFTAWLIYFNHSYTFKTKFLLYGLITVGGMFALSVGNIITYHYWGSSLVQWIQFGQDTPPPFSWRGFLAQAYHSLDAFWWLFLWGFWRIWQQRQLSPVLKAYSAALISGWILLPLTWPYLYDRILFMLAPLMLPFLAFGLHSLKAGAWLFLLFSGLSQLWIAHCIYFHQQQGWIMLHGLFFLCLFALLLLLKNSPFQQAKRG